MKIFVGALFDSHQDAEQGLARLTQPAAVVIDAPCSTPVEADLPPNKPERITKPKPEPPKPKAEGELTVADVSSAMMAACVDPKRGKEIVVTKLAAYGAAKASDVKPEDRAAFIESLNQP
jgi:hypothetical protein